MFLKIPLKSRELWLVFATLFILQDFLLRRVKPVSSKIKLVGKFPIIVEIKEMENPRADGNINRLDFLGLSHLPGYAYITCPSLNQQLPVYR